jgi:hypothetical protein
VDFLFIHSKKRIPIFRKNKFLRAYTQYYKIDLKGVSRQKEKKNLFPLWLKGSFSFRLQCARA